MAEISCWEIVLSFSDSTLNLGRIGVNALNEMIPLHVEKDKDQDDTQPSLLDLDRGNSLGT